MLIRISPMVAVVGVPSAVGERRWRLWCAADAEAECADAARLYNCPRRQDAAAV